MPRAGTTGAALAQRSSGGFLQFSLLRRLATSGWSVGPLSLLLGAALVTVGWFDYASTRREFDTLVRAQAASARDTVAAAARANRAAAAEARGQLAERLLDNARLLAEVDRRGPLTASALEEIAARNHLFRITVVGPDGTREHSVSPDYGGRGAGPGPGRGGGFGPGAGLGAGMGGGALLDRLLRGGEAEVVTELHEGRRAGAARLAAGVRRANGGAIVLSVDATAVANLQRQSSLDALLADIVGSTEDVAYIVFDDGSVQRSQGAKDEGQPALEIAGPIDIGAPVPAQLTLGMRLDRLRSAERRTLARLAISLASAAALGVLAIGFAWIRQRFGELSAKHALAQEALRRRDRLSAMGELASTVAHEIRNPLNAIAMSAQRLKKECLDPTSGDAPADPDDAVALVGVIQAETQRLNAKVQQFLEYARPPALDRRVVELSPWVAGIVNAVRPLAASRGITLGVESDSGSALLDPEQLRQALDNLLRNAIEATPEGGRVSVRTAVSPRDWTIEVRDTGAGIDPADLPRIFDLYFTTKRTGTGVGLAVTQQIVAGHGGTIEVNSAPSQGTVMRIRVPVAGEGAHA